MKKTIMKVGIIIMALTAMIGLSACSKINNETADDVCKALNEKYGEAFVATQIGDRFNTNHAKLYVHPADNEDLLFTAKIDKDTRIVEDDYVIQKVNSEVDKTVELCAETQSLTASSFCSVITREPLKVESGTWTPETFQKGYGFDYYLVYLLVNENGLTAEKLYNTMEKSGIDSGANIRFRVYVFQNENYQNCVDAMAAMPDANPTAIEKHAPVTFFWNDINEGVSSITMDELKRATGED